jgi:putative methyltransferase (TIGR04325 family)
MVPDTDTVWTIDEGWSHGSIAELQRKKWQAFLASVDGARPLGQSHEASPDSPADVGPHNTIMSFAYALGRAAAGRHNVSVLDWGGGAGHYYVYARRLYPELQLDFVIKDLPGLCDVGRELLPDATFVSDDEQALSRRYDFVFASSALHYTRDVYGLLGRLCDSAGRWLMVTRLPVLQRHEDFVVVQRPHMFGYLTEYPGWFINRKRLIDFVATRGFSLDREFLVSERPYVFNAPEQAQYAGFLFGRTDAGGASVFRGAPG